MQRRSCFLNRPRSTALSLCDTLHSRAHRRHVRIYLTLSVLFALAMSSTFAARSGEGAAHKALLLVANKGDHTLGLIDPEAGRQIATIDVGGVTGHEVVASPDGRFAYVPIYGDSGVGQPGSNGQTIEVIDLATQKIVNTIDLGRPVRPHCPKFGPDGLLYVTAELDNAVDIVDPRSQ